MKPNKYRNLENIVAVLSKDRHYVLARFETLERRISLLAERVGVTIEDGEHLVPIETVKKEKSY